MGASSAPAPSHGRFAGGAVPHVAMAAAMLTMASAQTVAHSTLSRGIFSPMLFNELRYLVALPLLLLVNVRHIGKTRLARPRSVVFQACVMFLANQTLGFIGNRNAGAAIACAMQAATPVLTYALSVLRGAEKLTAVKAMGTLVAVAGMLTLVGVGDLADSTDKIDTQQLRTGLLALVGQVFCNSVALVHLKSVLRLYTWPSYFTCQAIGMAALLSSVIVSVGTDDGHQLAEHWRERDVPFDAVLAILHTGAVVMVGGQLLHNVALSHLDASTSAVYYMLQPVFGVILAAVFLGEVLVGHQGVGFLLIMLGLVATTLGGSRRQPASTIAPTQRAEP